MARGETHVYVICVLREGRAEGPCKIGVSDNPVSRLASLQSGNPEKLVVYGTVSFPDKNQALFVERSFHKMYGEFRMEGEWFGMKPEMAERHITVALKLYKVFWEDMTAGGYIGPHSNN